MKQDMEMRQVTRQTEASLTRFFHLLEKAREDDFFRPHPFTAQEAARVADYSGQDFYAVALCGEEVIAYGMLRGWDEGYPIPSLGITVHPDYRGLGIGLAFMYYLQSVAVLRKCDSIRLRVNKNNMRARRLYERLGYRFEESNETHLVGYLNLHRDPESSG